MDFSLVNLLMVLLVAWLTGALANRLGYPSILGELAAGIIFGPAVLGWLAPNAGLRVLAEVGVFLMMLYIGIEIDHRELFGASWAGLLAATGSFFAPAILAYLILGAFQVESAERLLTSIILGVSSIVVGSRVLVDLRLLGTRVANVMIAGALITDAAGIVIFSGVLGIVRHGHLEFGALAAIAAKAVAFFGMATFVGVFVFPHVGRRLMQAGLTQRTANFTLVLLVGLVFAELAHLAGLHAILGAFLAGLFLREEVLMRKLSQDISQLVHDLSIGFLAPVFFVTVGFDVSLAVFRTDLRLFLVVLGLATLVKAMGTALFYLPLSRGWREALVVGMGMNGRGGVDVILAGLALRAGLIQQDTFSILVVTAFLATLTVPVLLRWGTNWLRRRNELVRADEERKGVIIVGAGPLARVVARELAASEPVKLIDTNEHNCTLARAEGLNVINANALSEDTFSLVDARRARTFLALTPNAEVNRFSADIARGAFGIPEVHVPALPRNGNGGAPGRFSANSGGTPLFGGGTAIHDWNRWIARREVRRTRLAVAARTSTRDFYKEISQGTDILPLTVVHEGRSRLFHTTAKLEVGDEVVALRRRGPTDDWNERIEGMLRDCPVLDLRHSVPLDEFFGYAAAELAERVRAPAAEIRKLLLDRERESSTVLLPGLAIPHVTIEGQRKFDILLARCREGIPFSETRQEVRTIFVLLGTRDERNTHLRVLSLIGQLYQDAGFEEKWLAASSAEELRRLVLSALRRRF